MNEQQQQFADMVASTNKIVNTATRQVTGGFVVTAATAYQDRVTGGYVYTKNDECVASTPEDACQKCLNFYRTGNFEGTPAPTPIEAAASAPATI